MSKSSCIKAKLHGIYEIVNLHDGKATAYVGRSRDIERRWRRHRRCLRSGNHYNQHLQDAWNGYGEQAFQFGVVELVENEDDLKKREGYWIKRYFASGAVYNIDRVSRGTIRVSEETRRKISRAKAGKKRKPFSKEWRRKLSLSLMGNQRAKGFKHTPETRRKVSLAGKGKPKSAEHNRKNSEAHRGKRCSEETRRKISEAQKGKRLSPEHRRKLSKSLQGVNAKPYPAIENKLTGEYIPAGINLSRMCREHGLNRRRISGVVHGRPRESEGWVLADYENLTGEGGDD